MSVSRTMFLNPYNLIQTSGSALPPSSHSPLFSESLSTSSSSTAPSTPLTDSNNNNLAGAISSASTKRKREVEVPAAGSGAENQERPSSANDLPISKRTRSTSAAPARTEEDAQTIASLQDRLTEERFQKTQAQKSHTRLHRRHAELRAILASEQDRANHALNILRSDNSQLQRDLMNERAAHAETSSKWEEESQNGLKLQDELDEERKKTVRAEERLAYEKEAREIVMKDAADTHKELQDMKETRAREKEEHDQRLTAVESAKDELTAALQRAEKVLADVGRETEDPFIVPAMLKAFEKISYFSSDAMSPTSTR
ncbi:hypothetical protein EUX98_g7415 [Antrodiella citrinella]|uniref:SWI5-dependent HO expression protein 3 n=1 Tax=Antrodiella citrinella TaxID=2447956 RepID=A0A4S4MM57_9APHY|nr:hypothetical protein EUX98_g7415 [Antrodiella citrinella]